MGSEMCIRDRLSSAHRGIGVVSSVNAYTNCIPKDIDRRTLSALLTVSGGEAIGEDDL